MARVWVPGSIGMDIVTTCAVAPAAGETVMGTGLHYFPGGKGGNQAVAARLNGAETLLAARMGQDDFGQQLKRFLLEKQVDVSHSLWLAEQPTAVAVIIVEEGGENRIVVNAGANMHDDPDEALDFTAGDICLCQNETRADRVLRIFAQSHAAEGYNVYNPAPFLPEREALAQACDLLIVNEVEFAQTAGRTEHDVNEENLYAMVATLGLKDLIVTLGSRGLVGLHQGQFFAVAGHKVETVDTTGAGDCFCGAFCAYLAAGQAFEEAARLANAAAALSTTRLGAGSSIPTREEVEFFLREQAL